MSSTSRPIVDLRNNRAASEVLLDVLRIIEAHGPSDIHEGICANIMIEMDSADPRWIKGDNRYMVSDFLDVAREWEGFSGFHHYPVPSPDEHLCPSLHYDATELMWEGKYGENRKALLKFAIAFLKKQTTLEKE